MIIFGKTVFTPKECYFIKFPQWNEHESHHLHQEDELRRIFLQIIQQNNFETSQLEITNTFVLFDQDIANADNSTLSELRNFKIHKSCKKYSLIFNYNSSFQIFQDENEEKETNETDEMEETATWYQAKVYIKGFNDILINNCSSIWS